MPTDVREARSQADYWTMERLLHELDSIVHGKTVNFREDAAVYQVRRRLLALTDPQAQKGQ